MRETAKENAKLDAEKQSTQKTNIRSDLQIASQPLVYFTALEFALQDVT